MEWGRGFAVMILMSNDGDVYDDVSDMTVGDAYTQAWYLTMLS